MLLRKRHVCLCLIASAAALVLQRPDALGLHGRTGDCLLLLGAALVAVVLLGEVADDLLGLAAAECLVEEQEVADEAVELALAVDTAECEEVLL